MFTCSSATRRLGGLAAASLLVALTLGIAPQSHAHHDGEIVERAGIRASHAWMAAPAETSHGAHVYLTIENIGEEGDRLLSVASPVAATSWVEGSILDAEGTMRVRRVEALQLDAGQTITLQPGSLRVVLDDLNKPLAEGELFPLTLTFEQAGEIEMVGEVEHGDVTDHEDPGS